METSHLGPRVPWSFIFCTLLSHASLYFFPSVPKEASLLTAEEDTDLLAKQNVIRVIFLLSFFRRTVVFGFALDL